MPKKKVWLVVSPGSLVLAAYTREDTAMIHVRATTGADITEVELRDRLSEEVREDLLSEEDFDGDTPIDDIIGASMTKQPILRHEGKPDPSNGGLYACSCGARWMSLEQAQEHKERTKDVDRSTGRIVKG